MIKLMKQQINIKKMNKMNEAELSNFTLALFHRFVKEAENTSSITFLK